MSLPLFIERRLLCAVQNGRQAVRRSLETTYVPEARLKLAVEKFFLQRLIAS